MKRRIIGLKNASPNDLSFIADALAEEFKDSVRINENREQIIIYYEDDEETEEKFQDVIMVIKKQNPSIETAELEENKSTRRVLYLENLDCANCGAKIERLCQRSLNNDFLAVDFVTKRFVIETSDTKLLDNLVSKVQEIASVVDPRIVVSEMTKRIKQNSRIKIDPIRKRNFIIGCSLFLLVWISKNIVLVLNDFSPEVKNILFYILVYVPYIVAYILLAGDVLMGALNNLRKGRVFDEKFLMFIATSTALIIGYYDEAMFVMIFYKLGELCQQYAVNYSRKSIAALIDIQPQLARIDRMGTIIEAEPEDVLLGDIIWVKPGERVPLDGVIVEGTSWIDTSALTGESAYSDMKPGDKILSGSISTDGNLKIKVTKIFGDSMVSKILNLVENASSLKSKSENFISKFAKYYTPTVVVLALLVAFLMPLIHPGYIYAWYGDQTHLGLKQSVFTALVFLVVSCPCALVISVPLGFFGGIGSCSKNGILVKGSNYLEALNFVDTIVFDKTGTLTKGSFTVSEVKATEGYTESEVLEYGAYVESTSTHPIGKSIVNAYGQNKINYERIKIERQQSGKGVSAYVDEKFVLAGKEEFLRENKIKAPKASGNGTIIYVAVDGKCIGYILIKDELKESAKETIKTLRSLGIKKIGMFTGDNRQVAEEIALELGIDKWYANMTPIDKVKKMSRFKVSTEGKTKVAFVGDGINDAPVLNSADVGIAMGGAGSDSAIEVADIVLMNDELEKLPVAIQIARKTRKVVIENIILALTVKLAVLIISIILPGDGKTGSFLILEAIFADVGVSLIAILNSLRAMRYTKKGSKK